MATNAASRPTRPGHVYGKLEQVFDEVWWAWGTVHLGPAMRIPRNMTIIRERGELVVIHPVEMPADEQRKIEALGPIKHIVRLGSLHTMDDPKYVARYAPTMWAQPNVRHPDGVKTDRELVPGGELPIAGASLLSFATSRAPEAVIHLPRHGGVLLACDSIQNWETSPGSSFLGKSAARLLGLRGRACIGPLWRKYFEPKDGIGFRPTFAQLLELDFRHALGGHGAPIKNTAKDDLRAQVGRIYKSA